MISADFYDQLGAALTLVSCGHRGGSVELVRAQFQADFFMAQGVLSGRTETVVANDGDFHILIGDESLSIKNFRIGDPDGICEIELASGSFATISEAVSCIGELTQPHPTDSRKH